MIHSLTALGQALNTPHIHSAVPADIGPGSILFVSGVGLVLGMRHATDADHIVALSTIVSKQRSIKRAALIGSIWGVGHTITIFVVGSLMILFHVHIPTRLGLSMEFSVAVMLVILGLLNLTGLTQRITESLTGTGHRNNLPSETSAGIKHLHAGIKSLTQAGVYHLVRPLVIGLVHGLAGSAAVALLVLSTIRSPAWAAAYLLIFGIGTILGMMLITTAVAIPLTYGGKRFTALNGYLALASGVASLCFGLFLMYRLGFVGGLFSQHPQWTPQ